MTNEDVLGNLIPALSQTFCIILTGFVSYEAFGPKGQRALELLVTRYALPCVVMVGIAGIDLTRVNWTFVLAVFIAKTVTFAVTVAASGGSTWNRTLPVPPVRMGSGSSG